MARLHSIHDFQLCVLEWFRRCDDTFTGVKVLSEVDERPMMMFGASAL